MVAQAGGGRSRPLVVTADPDLLDDVLRLAGSVGVEATVAVDAVAAADDWASASVVLVGDDLAADVARLRPPHRWGVIVVTTAPVPPWSAATALGAENVAVLPAAQTWLASRLAEHDDGGPAAVLAVVGGSSRAGASGFASALALAGRKRGLDTLLVDSYPRESQAPPTAADYHHDGLRWLDLLEARAGTAVLPPTSSGRGSLAVLTFDHNQLPMPPAVAMTAAIDAGQRRRDLVVVDVHRRLDEAGLVAVVAADRCVVVTSADLRACAAASRVAAAVRPLCAATSALVRSVSGGLRPSEVAEALGLPLLGVLPAHPRSSRTAIGQRLARFGRLRLAQLCRALLDDVCGEAGPSGVGRSACGASGPAPRGDVR